MNSDILNVYYIVHAEGFDFAKFNASFHEVKDITFEFNCHTYICTKVEKIIYKFEIFVHLVFVLSTGCHSI
jgi:hypothetical protein